MLAQIGMTPEAYEAERRQSLQISQLTEGIQLSDFLTGAELNRVYALENEQREIRFALLPVERYAAAKIDDAQIKAWYEAHPGDYMSPESVRLQYAQLSLDAIAAQVNVKDEDLQAYYEQNKSRYSEKEKRHAHHILISIDDAKDPKSDAAALAKAQQVLARAQGREGLRRAGAQVFGRSRARRRRAGISAGPSRMPTWPRSPMPCSTCNPDRSAIRSRRSTAITSSGSMKFDRRTCCR